MMSLKTRNIISMIAVFILALFLGNTSTRIYFYGLIGIFVIVFAFMAFRSTSRPEEDESFTTVLRLIMAYAAIYIVGGLLGLFLS